ncbi:MAG TPA: mucoidy inhibitor MuiA family protein [Opitutaceae bacterium]|nr:mucoidy inhibitor MuiA family protein [Opitutaceae bacterium]
MNTLARIRNAALLAGYILAGTASAAPLQSTITAATVYLDRAVVTRTGVIELAPGEHELVLSDLPASLLDQSLIVSGRGTARATILDVGARTRWLDFTPNDRVRDLEDQLKTFGRDMRLLDDRTGLLDRQLALLQNISNTATRPPGEESNQPRVSVEEWERLMLFANGGFARIATERQEVDFSREQTQEKMNRVHAELAQVRGAGGKNVKDVTVRVAVEGAGRLAVSLSYTLPDARWMPTYDARFSTSARTVALGYFGVVRQRTGEDWNNIDLTLSTARPSLGGAAPILNTWYLDLFQPAMVAQELRRREQSAKAAYAVSDMVAQAPAAVGEGKDKREYDSENVSATVAQGATSATFRIPVKANIPADNAPHKVGITTLPFQADLSYAATPKLVEAAFLSAKVKNDSDFPILAGPMAVFLDETFVANGGIGTVMTGEKFDLALGADDGIRIERKRLNRFTEEIGMISKETRITYDVLITVQNNRKTTEKITVRDQLPVSRNEKIVAKLLSPATKDMTQEPGGLLSWTFELKPGEKREIALKVSVTHPVEMQVSGLE